MNLAKFPEGLLDIQDKFQPNPVRNKQSVKFKIHIQGITKLLNFSSKSPNLKKKKHNLTSIWSTAIGTCKVP